MSCRVVPVALSSAYYSVQKVNHDCSSWKGHHLQVALESCLLASRLLLGAVPSIDFVHEATHGPA